MEVNILEIRDKGILIDEDVEDAISLQAAVNVLERNGFRFEKDCDDSLKYRDEVHGTYEAAHVPAHVLCVWIDWVAPLIESISYATKKTSLMVLCELLRESGVTPVMNEDVNRKKVATAA